jgi:hypothetical protein
LVKSTRVHWHGRCKFSPPIDEDIVKSYLVQRDDKEQFAYFLYREGEKLNMLLFTAIL